jgi:hypothetical protein
MVTALEHRFNSRFLPCRREMLLSQAQIKYVPKNRYKDCRTVFYDKPKSEIDTTDLEGFKRFMALRTSSSETRARGKNSEDLEGGGRFNGTRAL